MPDEKNRADLYLDPKTNLFKKGNPGRPPAKKISDEEAMAFFRLKLHEIGGSLEEAAMVLWENAVLHENQDGSRGKLGWMKLLLQYGVGLPATKIESKHTNVADVMANMTELMKQAQDEIEQEQYVVIDLDKEEDD